MSNVSHVHDIKPFKAGDKALSGQRLAKVWYKTTKKNPAKFPSVAVSIPPILMSTLTEQQREALDPFLRTLLENAQDGIVKSLYESSQGSLKTVQDSEISVDACIGFLRAESEGSRLTAEMIEKWFDSELAENLFALVTQKLGFLSNDADATLTPDQEKTVEKHVRIYRDVMTMLQSGGKSVMAEKQIQGCRRALELAPDADDPMVERLTERLAVMEGKNKEEFLDI